ncbi:hypothetical protein HCH_00697 [Hahella chejuensis KCTC 2396]|uniref:Outer membrane protein beta-barrel domain-containing protein n=1 Tax=Hahella chejuensis (strain KCTC 2396) TaxID=349521 RepID=Q2SP28_HAHCH|nr:hypothetical protein [Hahella chejuensis]ABC27596.1 hypothetical protein HCH_00697 [Hahella chejuensis KCTC 2396]
MNAVIKFASLTLFPVFAFAVDGGVADVNFDAGLDYTHSRHSDSYQLAGSANLPIYSFIGGNLHGNATQVDGHNERVNADVYSLGATVFARDYFLGKIGLSYSYSETDFDLPWADTADTDNYGVFAQYYLTDFTLSASRNIAKFDNLEDNHNSWNLGATWYANENVRTSLHASGMDSKDNYGIAVEYQPELFQNAASVDFSYSDGRKDDTFSVGFNYFFGTKVSLKDRDRKYR